MGNRGRWDSLGWTWQCRVCWWVKPTERYKGMLALFSSFPQEKMSFDINTFKIRLVKGMNRSCGSKENIMIQTGTVNNV